MKRTQLPIFSLMILMFAPLSHAQNDIDPAGSGGFVALLPDGNIDPETGFPTGTTYDGSLIHSTIWQNATQYLARVGEGYLKINNAADTDVYIDGSVSYANNTEPMIYANINTNRLRIFSTPSSQLSTPGTPGGNNGKSSILIVDNAGRVEIHNGSYVSEERNNQATTGYAIGINNTAELYIKNTLISGPSIVRDFVGNNGGVIGGTGLFLNSVTSAVIDFENDRNQNHIIGGNGEISENTFGADTPSAGSAITATNSTLFATNLFAEGGVAGSANGFLERDTIGTVSFTANGGDGIISTSSIIHLNQGEIIATDGGSFGLSVIDGTDWDINFQADGGNGINGGTGSGILSHVNIIAGNAGKIAPLQDSGGTYTLSLNGGSAYTGNMDGGSITMGTFTGGNGVDSLNFTAGSAIIFMNGGDALNAVGSTGGTVHSGNYVAGHGGTATIATTGSEQNIISGSGGDAFSGPSTLVNGNYIGGNGGVFHLTGSNETTAQLDGGAAARVSGISTLYNGFYQGGHGGVVSVENGDVQANGGNAIHQTDGTLEVYGGIYIGGNGGFAYSDTGISVARAGLGAYITSNATFHGGSFRSGLDGQAAPANALFSNVAVWLDDAEVVTIQGTTELNGDLLVADTLDLSLLGGSIYGDVRFASGTTRLNATENAYIEGDFILESGTVNTFLNTPSDGAVYQQLHIYDGEFNFMNQPLETAPHSSLTLYQQNSRLNLEQGATLSANSRWNVNFGTLESRGDLIIQEGSSIHLLYDGATNGIMDISGAIDLSASDSRVSLTGHARTHSGSLFFGSADEIRSPEKIDIQLGWLTQITNLNTTGTLQADYGYLSITNNQALADLGEQRLLSLDASISNGLHFAMLNALGSEAGADLIRYDETQSPDIADAVLDNQSFIHQQIAARTTEIRSRTGFAFLPSKGLKPAGVAAPRSPEKNRLKGWIRGYGAFGSRNQSGHYEAYDTTYYGSVIGLDKQVGSLLIGIAGGTSSLNIDGGSTYDADSTGFHGSLYSSWQNHKRFIDLSISKTEFESDASNLLTTDQFNTDAWSVSIGTGQEFMIQDRLAWLPSISYQHTQYHQDAYIHNGLNPKRLNAYDSTSDQISIGMTLATDRQIEWFNRRLAMIPEIRVRWLHELNASLEPSTFSYINGNGTGSIHLRPREENLFTFGIGIDFWSWHSYSTKFEFDYDHTLAEDFSEQVFSGKVTFQF
jgi:hypothetical protein